MGRGCSKFFALAPLIRATSPRLSFSTAKGKRNRLLRRIILTQRDMKGKEHYFNTGRETKRNKTSEIGVAREQLSVILYKQVREITVKTTTDLPINGFVVLPYVQGISEKIGRILRQQEIKVAYKPLKTVNSLFPRPKSQNDVDRPRSGVVYKINCTNCNFVYYGQTERPLKTRITEHKRAVAMFDHDSKISCHVHENNHHMDFNAVSLVGHEPAGLSQATLFGSLTVY